jgi:hypothetical protein
MKNAMHFSSCFQHDSGIARIRLERDEHSYNMNAMYAMYAIFCFRKKIDILISLLLYTLITAITNQHNI